MSKLKKLPCHVAKETDVSLWKQYSDRTKKKSGVCIRAFRCLLKQRTGCCAGIRMLYGPDWMQLDLCSEHNANSHNGDKPKYLKYDQIVAISDAVTMHNSGAICNWRTVQARKLLREQEFQGAVQASD